jgi:hypothetical protein
MQPPDGTQHLGLMLNILKLVFRRPRTQPAGPGAILGPIYCRFIELA